MSKTIEWFILGIIIGLVVGGVMGSLYGSKFHRGNFGNLNNIQISEESQSEVTIFFESNPDQATLDAYCQNNMNSCMYYCRELNRNNELCSQILNMSKGGMPQRK